MLLEVSVLKRGRSFHEFCGSNVLVVAMITLTITYLLIPWNKLPVSSSKQLLSLFGLFRLRFHFLYVGYI